MKIGSILSLLVLVLFGFGCASKTIIVPAGSAPAPETTTGTKTSVLDSMLDEKGQGIVTALVRLTEPLSGNSLASLLSKEPALSVVSFNAVVDGNRLQIGTTPFSGTVSDDNIRAAVASFWRSKLITDDLEANPNEQFLINQCTVSGNADRIRSWWHGHSDQIAEVIVKS